MTVVPHVEHDEGALVVPVREYVRVSTESVIDELIFQNSPIKMVLIARCAAGFIAIPFALTGRVPFYKEVLLWAGALFFVGCLLAAVGRFFASGPAMRFTHDGFEAKCYGIPFVPWNEIESVWTVLPA